MAAVMKMLGMAMVLVVPGGLVILCAFFLARAIHHLWAQQSGRVPTKLYRAMAGVRFRDVLREARATF
jgi:hypothetical protein